MYCETVTKDELLKLINNLPKLASLLGLIISVQSYVSKFHMLQLILYYTCIIMTTSGIDSAWLPAKFVPVVLRVDRSCSAKKLTSLPAGCREAANCRYYIYSQAKNQVFRPAGATRCTDLGQTWQGRRAPGSTWLCKISPQSAQGAGNAAQKYQKFSLFGKESPRS